MYYCISISLTLDIFNYFNINAYYFIFQKTKKKKKVAKEIYLYILYTYALHTPKMNVFSMTKMSTLNNNKLKIFLYIF